MGLTYEEIVRAVQNNIGRGLIFQHSLYDIEIRVPVWRLVLMYRLAILLVTVKETPIHITVRPLDLWQTLTVWRIVHQCAESSHDRV